MCQKDKQIKKQNNHNFSTKMNLTLIYSLNLLSMDNSLWEFVYASPNGQSVPCSWVSITWYDISI